MRRFIALIYGILALTLASFAQNPRNLEADGILGEYEVRHQGEVSKVRITRDTDGTYKAQVFWVADRLDKKGNVRLDTKNPDKSLRHVECDRIVLMSGLKYDSEGKVWSGTKVYDPTRGLRANVVCEFQDDGTLRVKGSLLGFSQSIYWKPIQ